MVEVQLGAAEIRMGFDTAVRGDQQAAVIADGEIVRADTVGLVFADAAIVFPRIVKADDPTLGVEIVLAGIEEPAIGRKAAMPEEVPVLGGFIAANRGGETTTLGRGGSESGGGTSSPSSASIASSSSKGDSRSNTMPWPFSRA